MIINLGNGAVTVIDEIGTLFWNAIVNDVPEEIFISEMLEKFNTNEERLKKDYNDFITRLKADGVL